MDKSKYFFRIALYSIQNELVSLIDLANKDKEPVELEPWLGVIVALADGQHTIAELLEHLASRYDGSAPAELEKTVESVLERLEGSTVLKLADEKVTLPYYLSQPIESLDMERAKKLMQEDNFPML